MCGYMWILLDMGIFGWIWEDWGAGAAEGFAKLRRCSRDLRAQVQPPKKLVVETWNLAINRI